MQRKLRKPIIRRSVLDGRNSLGMPGVNTVFGSLNFTKRNVLKSYRNEFMWLCKRENRLFI